MAEPESLSDELIRLTDSSPVAVERIAELIRDAAQRVAPEDLDGVAAVAAMDSLLDEFVAVPAIAVLPNWGESGLRTLQRAVREAHQPTNALSLLLAFALEGTAGIGDLSYVGAFDVSDVMNYPDGLAPHARRLVRELALDRDEILGVPQHLRQIDMLWAVGPRDELPRQRQKAAFFLRCLSDTQLHINEQIVSDFVSLLQAGSREQDLHECLERHPVLLDPLADKVVSKHRLGSDYITDFVIRRLNNDYVAVEIEKATDPIFTADGSLHHKATHAISQVRDFQAWIHENLSYARTTLPGINRPEGLLVIGMRSALSESAAKRLEEENFARRGHVRIVTFDDLATQATLVYRNLVARGEEQGPI